MFAGICRVVPTAVFPFNRAPAVPRRHGAAGIPVARAEGADCPGPRASPPARLDPGERRREERKRPALPRRHRAPRPPVPAFVGVAFRRGARPLTRPPTPAPTRPRLSSRRPRQRVPGPPAPPPASPLCGAARMPVVPGRPIPTPPGLIRRPRQASTPLAPGRRRRVWRLRPVSAATTSPAHSRRAPRRPSPCAPPR